MHMVEGEGGLTPGRVAEVLAAAGTASLENAFLHLDWNQASMDTDRVCAKRGPGGLRSVDSLELFYLHDWNVIYVPDGRNMQQILNAQQLAASLNNGQPTAIVYRTVKGWRYGIEGTVSHGAGHKLCSAGYYEALSRAHRRRTRTCFPPATPAATRAAPAPTARPSARSASGPRSGRQGAARAGDGRRSALAERLRAAGRASGPARALAACARARASRRSTRRAARDRASIPDELRLTPGSSTTMRGALGEALRYLNKASGGAVFTASADLYGSTSVSAVAADFAPGFFNAATNPEARLLVRRRHLRGRHRRCPLRHLDLRPCRRRRQLLRRLHGAAGSHRRAAALHRRPGAPGRQRRAVQADDPGLRARRPQDRRGRPHARRPAGAAASAGGLPPRHAVTLTPWEPQEVWPLLATALAQRPAVIAPFVTRPNETVLDRPALGLAPAEPR